MAPERTQRLVRIASIGGTVVLSALLTARGTTQLVAAAVLPASPGGSQQGVRASANAATDTPVETPESAAQAILLRNIFDSQTGSLSWVEVTATPELTDENGQPSPDGADFQDPVGEPAVCTGSMRLVGSMVSPFSPVLSFASIEAGGKTLLYRQGMSVDAHELVGIREHRVFLRPAGRPLCQLSMFTPAAPPPPKSSISEEDLNAGITQVSDTNYNISRQLLDRVLGAQSELMRAARVIPYEENGRTVGVKVYGIRRNALLGKLGIQNGDVLRTINGFDLSSPDSALEAYTKLREMDQFSISMIRRGAPRTMEYQVK